MRSQCAAGDRRGGAGFAGAGMVLDGEAIAYDAKGRPRRSRSRCDVSVAGSKSEDATELPVRACFFDCLRLDDGAWSTARCRSDPKRCRGGPGSSARATAVTSSALEARSFYEAALAAGHEGVMAKALDSPYEAGNRGASWLKIKRAHTLDLVVLAAEWGHGRRAGKLSNLHLGALDRATGGYVMSERPSRD